MTLIEHATAFYNYSLTIVLFLMVKLLLLYNLNLETRDFLACLVHSFCNDISTINFFTTQPTLKITNYGSIS